MSREEFADLAEEWAGEVADDLEPAPLLPAEVEEITFEQSLFELGVALMWAAWGIR
jgi:hypothetical protein